MKGIKYRGRKSLLPKADRHSGLGINRYFTYEVMPYGSARRKAILEHLESIKDLDHFYMVINKKYCPILKKDKDLQRLLKEGKLKMIKIRESRRHSYSALVLNIEG